jgi:hypothetical protein
MIFSTLMIFYPNIVTMRISQVNDALSRRSPSEGTLALQSQTGKGSYGMCPQITLIFGYQPGDGRAVLVVISQHDHAHRYLFTLPLRGQMSVHRLNPTTLAAQAKGQH